MVTIAAILAWITANSGLITLIFVVATMIVNLTPTEKDNSILAIIKKIFDFIIPNIKKGKDGKISLHTGEKKNLFSRIFKK